jgi:8-oxo-dGDP phosphatase
VHRVPLAEAVRRVYAGEVTNAAAVAGILAAAYGAETGWAGLRPAHSPWSARPDH